MFEISSRPTSQRRIRIEARENKPCDEWSREFTPDEILIRASSPDEKRIVRVRFDVSDLRALLAEHDAWMCDK